jgi:hypothetical protein
MTDVPWLRVVNTRSASLVVSPIVHVLTFDVPRVPICVDPLRRAGHPTLRGQFASDGMTVFGTEDPVDCMSCLVEETRRRWQPET